MAENYCYVENGVVKEGPMPVPKSWKNISGLKHANNTELKALGWLPFEEVSISYDIKTHYREGYKHDIQADKVIYTDIIKAYTDQQMKQNAWNDWKGLMFMSDNPENFDKMQTGIPRISEDLMDLMDEIDPTLLDKSKYAKLKERRETKRALRATKPPQP